MPAAKPPEFRRRAVAQLDTPGRHRRWPHQGPRDRGALRAGRAASAQPVLEMELEILKRVSAYVARENILPK